MAPKRATRSTPVTTTPAPTATTTTMVTNAQLQAMIDQGVSAVLAARDATRNGTDSQLLGTELWSSTTNDFKILALAVCKDTSRRKCPKEKNNKGNRVNKPVNAKAPAKVVVVWKGEGQIPDNVVAGYYRRFIEGFQRSQTDDQASSQKKIQFVGVINKKQAFQLFNAEVVQWHQSRPYLKKRRFFIAIGDALKKGWALVFNAKRNEHLGNYLDMSTLSYHPQTDRGKARGTISNPRGSLRALWRSAVGKDQAKSKPLVIDIKVTADLKRKPMEFQSGDKVMLKGIRLGNGFRYVLANEGKLNPRYVGPFKVLEKVGEVAYKLELPEDLV
ncbi:hypothetical protein Tco_1133390 [Tanacetum coccineum]